MEDTEGDVYYYGKNIHGDIVELYDSNGTNVCDYRYDAYGNQKTTNANDTNPFRYAGEYYDAETGLIYLRARYYDSSIGRFITEDTHWNIDNMIYGDKEYEDGEIKNPDVNAIAQSSNLYAYCMNNPMHFVDPSGDLVTVATVGAKFGLILGGNAQVLCAFDDKGKVAILAEANASNTIGASIGASGMVFLDMPSVECFVDGDSISMGLSGSKTGGGVSIVKYNDKEYTGIYLSYEKGLDMDLDTDIQIDGELSLKTITLYKNY